MASPATPAIDLLLDTTTTTPEPGALSELPEELRDETPAPTPEAQAQQQTADELQQAQARLRELEIENSVLRVAREERPSPAPAAPAQPVAPPVASKPNYLDGYDVDAAFTRLRAGDLTAVTEMVNHAADKAAATTRQEMTGQMTAQTLSARDEQAALTAFPELQIDPASRQPGNPEFYQRVKQTVEAWNNAAGHYTPGTIMAAAKSVAFDMQREGKLNAQPPPTPAAPPHLRVLPRPAPPNPGLGETTGAPSAATRDPLDDLSPQDRALLVQNAKKMGVDPKKAYENYLKHRKENPGYGSGR